MGSTRPGGRDTVVDGLAAQHGLPTAFVVHAPLHKPEADSVLAAQSAFQRVRGVRFILSWHSDPNKNFAARPDYMEDSKWLAGFARLRRYDLSFDLMLYPGQLEQATQARRTLSRHPSHS